MGRPLRRRRRRVKVVGREGGGRQGVGRGRGGCKRSRKRREELCEIRWIRMRMRSGRGGGGGRARWQGQVEGIAESVVLEQVDKRRPGSSSWSFRYGEKPRCQPQQNERGLGGCCAHPTTSRPASIVAARQPPRPCACRGQFCSFKTFGKASRRRKTGRRWCAAPGRALAQHAERPPSRAHGRPHRRRTCGRRDGRRTSSRLLCLARVLEALPPAGELTAERGESRPEVEKEDLRERAKEVASEGQEATRSDRSAGRCSGH